MTLLLTRQDSEPPTEPNPIVVVPNPATPVPTATPVPVRVAYGVDPGAGSREDRRNVSGAVADGDGEPELVASVPSPITDSGTIDAITVDFDQFYEREFARVVAVVHSLTGSRHTAEEIAQEAFVTAHRKWSRIGSYDRPGDWVRRVAVNRAISSFRRKLAEGRAIDKLRATNRPEVALEMAETDEWLWLEVRKLPARQAQVVALVYVEDLSVERVAQILSCSQGTVKTHLHRARAALATAIQNRPEGRGR